MDGMDGMDDRRRGQQKSGQTAGQKAGGNARERAHVQRFQRFGPGEVALDLQPADFLLTHGNSLLGRLIRVGERLHNRGPDRTYARWNHVALLVDVDGGLIEADERGVHRAEITKYEAVEYYLVRIEASDEARTHAVQFAEWCLRERLGRLTFVSIALSLLTGSKLDFGLDGQETCSGLVARSLEHAGFIMETDPSRAMPSDLARQFAVEPPPPGTPIGDPLDSPALAGKLGSERRGAHTGAHTRRPGDSSDRL